MIQIPLPSACHLPLGGTLLCLPKAQMVPSIMTCLFRLGLSQNFAVAKEERVLAQVLLHLLPPQDLRHSLRQVLHQQLQQVLVEEREALVLHGAQLLTSLILRLSYTMGARISTTMKS